MKFNADLFGTGNFEKTHGTVAIEGHLAIGRIMADDHLVLSGESQYLFVEGALCRGSGGVVRIVYKDHPGTPGDVGRNSRNFRKELILIQQRHEIGLPAGEKRSHMIDGVCRGRYKRQIARVDESQGEMGNSLLGTNHGYHLFDGVQFNPEPAAVPIGDTDAKIIHAGIGGVLMGGWILCGLLQCLDDVLGGGQIRVSNAQIDHVNALADELCLKAVNLLKKIRGKLLQSFCFFNCHQDLQNLILFPAHAAYRTGRVAAGRPSGRRAGRRERNCHGYERDG